MHFLDPTYSTLLLHTTVNHHTDPYSMQTCTCTHMCNCTLHVVLILCTTHTQLHKYKNTYSNTYKGTHTYIQYKHTYIHTYIHTYCTYIHTYIHTYILYIHTYSLLQYTNVLPFLGDAPQRTVHALSKEDQLQDRGG